MDDRTIKALQVQAQQKVAATVEQVVSRLDALDARLGRIEAALSAPAPAPDPKKASK